MHRSQDPKHESILAEELTSAEVMELLERLNVRDMGGSENATISSVMEATGASSILVARLLAEIRNEELEDQFGQRLTAHEGRINSLEDRTRQLESKPYPTDRRLPEWVDFSGEAAPPQWIIQLKTTLACGAIAVVLLLCSGVLCNAPR